MKGLIPDVRGEDTGRQAQKADATLLESRSVAMHIAKEPHLCVPIGP